MVLKDSTPTWSSVVANLNHLNEPQVVNFRSQWMNTSGLSVKTSKLNKSQHSKEKYISNIDFSPMYGVQ